MTWLEALEIVVARTGHERYRVLCADSWPDHASYRQTMITMATGEPPPDPPRVPVADSLRATRLGFHNCWFSTRDSECGCSGLQCHLHKRLVTLSDCVACLRP